MGYDTCKITFLSGLGGMNVLFLSIYDFLLAICIFLHVPVGIDCAVAEGHAYGTGHISQHITVSINSLRPHDSQSNSVLIVAVLYTSPHSK